MKSNKSWAMMLPFALAFTLFPLLIICLCYFDAIEDANMLVVFAVLSIFLIIGIIFFIITFKNLARAKREKYIVKHGIERSAIFISASSNITVNGVSYSKIKYTWQGENGVPVESVSPSIYTSAEVNYLQQKQNFTIKTCDADSVITEELKGITKTTKQIKADLNKKYKYCTHCGSKLQEGISNCQNCGAVVEE